MKVQEIFSTEFPMNITSLFYTASKKFPGKIALIEKENSISFSELEKEIDATANYFLEKGILKGDRVLVFVPMSIDLYRVVLALFKIGAVAVFLDEWVNKERLEVCCRIANCKGFIAPFKIRIMGIISKEIRKIPVKLKLGKRNFSPQNNSPVNCNEEDTALITFTTGSTGTPKAADRSHGFLAEQFKALEDTIQPKENDVDMPVLPVVLLMNLGAGCTSVIPDWKSSKPNEFLPEKIFHQIKKNKITRITASPFFILKLGEYLIEKKIVLSGMEKMFTGGAPVFPTDAEIFLKAFPKTKTTIVYGSTEAEPISEIIAEELVEAKNKILNGIPVGKIYEKAEVRIIPITTNDLTQLPSACAPNEIGEIIVNGPHVLKKYFNNQEAFRKNKIVTENKIWHRTGDSGFIGENGNLFLTGRCSTLFYDGEKLVSPFLLEGFLKNIPGIKMGTALKHNQKIIFFVEATETADKNLIESEIKKSGINFSEIKYCQVPRDPRHFSKVDYGKLLASHTKIL